MTIKECIYCKNHCHYRQKRFIKKYYSYARKCVCTIPPKFYTVTIRDSDMHFTSVAM